jgi:hypothetical protein
MFVGVSVSTGVASPSDPPPSPEQPASVTATVLPPSCSNRLRVVVFSLTTVPRRVS